MSEHESCLVTKLSHYYNLDDASREQLAALEQDEEYHQRGTDIFNSEDHN